MSSARHFKTAVNAIHVSLHPAPPPPDLRDFREIYTRAASQNLYQTLPLLRSEDGEIRLISIQPGKTSDPLECTVATASLRTSPPPQYEALSYTWHDSVSADARSAISVRLNGILTFVLPNLGCALEDLRLEDKERVLWIDFLCIDQTRRGDPHSEVNSQVRQMGTIYGLATRVIIFLGRAEEQVSEKCSLLLDELGTDTHFDGIFGNMTPSGRLEKATDLNRYLSHRWFSRICKHLLLKVTFRTMAFFSES